MLGEPHTFLVRKTLSPTTAPHLRTQHSINKLDATWRCESVLSRSCYHTTRTTKRSILSIVCSWIEGSISPDPKTPEIRHSKGLLRYCQELDRLLIEEHGQFLCYNETSDTLDKENLRICLPLSLSLACFRMGHYNELGGHMGASETYANANRFYYWPGMFDWICALTADCLACQNTKSKPKHLNEVPLEDWQGDTAPFCALHNDPKRHLHPPSNRNTLCLLKFDFFRVS